MKLTIIIPSYNEAPTLPQIISKILKTLKNYQKELIVVDDGSTDNTAGVMLRFAGDKRIKFIINKKNLGKGASIIRALAIAKGDIIAVQDADLEYEPQDLPRLIDLFKDKNVKVVYGSRVLGKNPVSHWTFNLGGRFVTFITNLLFRTQITDEPTGYKLFRKDLLIRLKLKSKRFEFCPEVTAKLAKNNIKIHELPIHYHPRPVSEKKIKWYDGLAAIFYLIKYRLVD